MKSQPRDPKRINASPTKEFFIYMLTRDIPLSRAILDLVDNSVDGARRIRPDLDFDGLWIRLELGLDYFRIEDNCGGIPVNTARDYAFRFGRPADAPPTPGSVGQFGVGMKRTFFKLGKHFSVRSSTVDSFFELDVDVEVWKTPTEGEENPEEWHFEFSKLEEEITNHQDEAGTKIAITDLNESVGDTFSLESFITSLTKEISVAHAQSMERGLGITVNQIALSHERLTLFVSKDLRPANVTMMYREDSDHPVRVKLMVGLSSRELREAGWYVYCNGRLVLRADQTSATIWGATHNVRQYHPDFAQLRGFAFFECDDASQLPWTTTKTGIDSDSPIYRSVQQHMVELSKPVLKFLTDLEKERADAESGDAADRPLNRNVSVAKAMTVDTIEESQRFHAPQAPSTTRSGPRMQKIQYSKPLADVERAKRLLDVTTFVAVGEKTFEYFMEYEDEGDE